MGTQRRPTGWSPSGMSHTDGKFRPYISKKMHFAEEEPEPFEPFEPKPPLCWCGGPHQHDWPGKADGLPHPREPWHD
jgi:hypothetical protein